MIETYLDDLDQRIDPEVEERLESEWIAFTEGANDEAVFSPRRPNPNPPSVEWPSVTINHAQVDLDAMLLQQYGGCSGVLSEGGGALLTIRANYGTAILPTLFGAELFVMDEALNTLQTSRPLGADAMQGLVENGVPHLESGLGSAVLKTGERFAEIANQYPKIGRHVHIYHPDLQGPMDVCEMLWGSDLFVALIEKPELVHQVLTLLTDTYITFMKKWNEIVMPSDSNWATHWGMMHAGKIMIRTDSGMNLSPDMYDEFIRPYDQRLFLELGGGAVHFCGRGSHYIESACNMDQLYAINMSQPHLNEMETIYQHTVDKGIKLLGFSRQHSEAAIAAGRDLHGCVHCWP